MQLNEIPLSNKEKAMIQKKETRGGHREGAGRKSPFKEKTLPVKFTCPISKVDELKKYVNGKFAEWIEKGV